MTAYAAPLPVYPLKAVVVCNADVPWSRSTAEYWAAEHGVDCVYVDVPFGTAVTSAAAGGSAGTYIKASNAEAFAELFAPVGAAAAAHGARAVFMGPATPMRVRWQATFPSPYITEDLLPPLMSHIIGVTAIVNDGVLGLPEAVISGEFVWPSEPAGRRPVNANASRYGSVPTGGSENYGVMVGGPFDVARGPQSIIRTMRGRFGIKPGHFVSLSPTSNRQTALLNGYRVLTGRIGKPVMHSDGTLVRGYMGDETEAETLAIIDACIANEADIETHKDRPVYVGISYRLSSMSDSSCMAAVNILQRAGFTDVRYFTRNIVNTANMAVYAPLAGREFAYPEIPSLPPRPCFMHFGYALHNQRPGDPAADSSSVSGVDIDNLFQYEPGSVAYSGTSFALRHPMRAVKQGGGGGWGVLNEPGMRTPPHWLVYALLHGYSLAEAVEVATEFPNTFHCTIGDPLYSPFRLEAPPSIEWWSPAGTAPDEVVSARAPLDISLEQQDLPLPPPEVDGDGDQSSPYWTSFGERVPQRRPRMTGHRRNLR